MKFVSIAFAFLPVASATILSACSIAKDPRTVVAERQADMRELSAAMAFIQAEASSRKIDIVGARTAAEKIHFVSRNLESQFKTNSEIAGRAKPEIWRNPSQFVDEVRKFQKTSGELLNAVQTGRADSVSREIANLEGDCASCHKAFRGSTTK